MNREQDIDELLQEWPFDPANINVRLLESRQREVLQMRVDMGILQLETEGRPDGIRPNNANTYYDFLQKKAAGDSANFQLDEEDCIEIDREFVQFYHRRVCWLQLKKFSNAVRDADHTLGLMDFCKEFSPDEQWTISHEQYRPFVLYHRTQAAALSRIDVDLDEEHDEEVDSTAESRAAAELAIEEVNIGMSKLRELFVEYEAEDQFEEDELVERLIEFREGLRSKYDAGATLKEQLNAAIDNEDYEAAADLRDRLSKRNML